MLFAAVVGSAEGDDARDAVHEERDDWDFEVGGDAENDASEKALGPHSEASASASPPMAKSPASGDEKDGAYDGADSAHDEDAVEPEPEQDSVEEPDGAESTYDEDVSGQAGFEESGGAASAYGEDESGESAAEGGLWTIPAGYEVGVTEEEEEMSPGERPDDENGESASPSESSEGTGDAGLPQSDSFLNIRETLKIRRLHKHHRFHWVSI